MIWIIEKTGSGLHEKLFQRLKELAELGEPEIKKLGMPSKSDHEIYLIFDVENAEELAENAENLFNEIVELVKSSESSLVILNLGSPFEYETFKFAIVSPANKIQIIIEELLFDLFTYSSLWLFSIPEIEISDPIQIYTDKTVLMKVISNFFEQIKIINDVAILKSSKKEI